MGETNKSTSSLTNESSQLSAQRQKFDVFLSHSGKQKNFIRQLFRDLTNQSVSCFFDEDHVHSLRVAEEFPSRIFEAAKTCKVAVLLLSMDFLESMWPMQELSAFVEAKATNPNLKILPLFFMIQPHALKQITADNEKWSEFKKSEDERNKWVGALSKVRKFTGLKFSEGDDEVKFRGEIVKEIRRILPTPTPRYDVRGMQGEERMCQELANFFNKLQPNRKGIRIAGLYGTAGQGKSTLGKAFCNFKLEEFEGRVCHLEFSKGDPMRNIKFAVQNLTHVPDSYVQSLTSQDQAKFDLDKGVEGKRVLLVLDNITEESREEVVDYLKADMGKDSWILLSARSVDVLEKYFQIDSQSCMRVPRLEEEEAVAILLERALSEESILKAEDRGFALKCAKRCLFKDTSCDISPRARSFHPLALKAFRGYLLSKHGLNLSKWVDEIDGMVDGAGDGLDEVFIVLGKAFDNMNPKYRTIFMLLTVYMLPNMCSNKVFHWLAINCNEEISFIRKAVEDLRNKTFIEEFVPEIRVHDLYIEFAQIKANKMERWLSWKKHDDQYSTRALIAQDKDGFELAKLQQCMYQRIASKYVGNLFALQLVDVKNMSKLDLGPMDSLRSITLLDCKSLVAVDRMEKFIDLGWLQIRGVHPMFKLPELSSLQGLQHLEIDIASSQVVDELGDLTHCSRLREIYVVCRSLLEFPGLKGMKKLEKVEFTMCDKAKGVLDCRDCEKLQTIVLNFCCQMAAAPLLTGCNKLSKLILWECDAVSACPDVDAASDLKTLELFISSKIASAPKNLDYFCVLESLQLWNMGELIELPSFKRLSKLTVLKLGKCGIREPPDLTGCNKLEDVYFFTLKNLLRFPDFSSLKELRKLSLCDCISVQDPPYIEGCHKLQVFHLLYNDNMKGISKMDKCLHLEEVNISWHSKGEVTYEGIDPDNCQVDEELESCLDYWKDANLRNLFNVNVPLELLEWIKSKSMLVLAKKFFRGVKLYYSVTAPYYSFSDPYGRPKRYSQSSITLKLIHNIVMVFPTLARKCQDHDWLSMVRGYFDGREDIARASAASDVAKVFSCSLPRHSQRYPVPPMQGRARMCQALADFFNTVCPNKKGIRIAGLYGMPGQGKTTLGKTFCNLNLSNFYGDVCHLEFCGGNPLQRLKLALQYLTHCDKWHLDSLITPYEASQKLYQRLRGQTVLLVLDNITQESVEEVGGYLVADLGENSCVLLSARSEDLLKKNFNINSESCMSVPGLEEEEAIAILLERSSLEESALGAENRHFALQCAKRCSFKKITRDLVGVARTFHPLALKLFGRHLFSKYGAHVSQWIAEADGSVFGSGDGLDDVFILLDKAFDYMDPKYRTIFMLLTLYKYPVMSSLNFIEWLAITCMEEIEYIVKAVEGLRQEGFIEEIEPEIRIHDVFVEFAKSKARKMKRWLWCKHDPVTSEAEAALSSKNEAGFELANVEYCHQLDLSTIGDNFINNIWALQVVNDFRRNYLRFSLMKHLRSATLEHCEYLGVLGGIENLPYLAVLKVGEEPDLKVLNLSSLNALQYLNIDIDIECRTGGPTELGDLSGCVFLREIYVSCTSLSEFPGINGLQYLEKASFICCDEVLGPLDCSDCVKLQIIVFESCRRMAHIPLIVGCSNLSKIVLKDCCQVIEYSDEYESRALEISELCMSSVEDSSAPRHAECCDGFTKQPLWNIVLTWEIPNLRRLSNLTVLKLYKLRMSEPPDVTCCSLLEEVYFFTLKNLWSFPNFSSLKKLKILCLCNCNWVRAPPVIGGCEGLETFHLLYNDNMEELPQMDDCPLLQEFKLSWPTEEAVDPEQDDDTHGFEDDYIYSEDDGVEFCPDYQNNGIFRNLTDVHMPVELKEWQWIQGKTVRVKKYYRGVKEYYCMTAPYEAEDGIKLLMHAESSEPVIIPSAGF